MNDDKQQMKTAAKKYLEIRQNQDKLMQQQAALHEVQKFRKQYANKSPAQYTAAVKKYYNQYYPEIKGVKCEITEVQIPLFSPPVGCTITSGDGKEQDLDLDQLLKTEFAALKTRSEELDPVEVVQQLRRLSHTPTMDEALIQQLAQGNFTQLGSVDQMLNNANFDKIDQQAKEALNRFVSDLFVNQKAISTLGRKFSELTANFKNNKKDLEDFITQLDANIAQTTIGNFVERTALGIACSVKEQPDMCSDTAGAGKLPAMINNSRKKYGKALIPESAAPAPAAQDGKKAKTE